MSRGSCPASSWGLRLRCLRTCAPTGAPQLGSSPDECISRGCVRACTMMIRFSDGWADDRGAHLQGRGGVPVGVKQHQAARAYQIHARSAGLCRQQHHLHQMHASEWTGPHKPLTAPTALIVSFLVWPGVKCCSRLLDAAQPHACSVPDSSLHAETPNSQQQGRGAPPAPRRSC